MLNKEVTVIWYANLSHSSECFSSFGINSFFRVATQMTLPYTRVVRTGYWGVKDCFCL